MPMDERCVSVSAGYYHSMVLTDDGQILAVSASKLPTIGRFFTSFLLLVLASQCFAFGSVCWHFGMLPLAVGFVATCVKHVLAWGALCLGPQPTTLGSKPIN